jgi:hypothetical protein
MVGSFYFMRRRSDWAYTSIYGALFDRNLKKIAHKQNFDLNEAEQLKNYVQNLETQLRVFGLLDR